MSPAKRLRQFISAPEIVLVPGCWDALSALMAEQAGFASLYLSGASIAYTRLGRSDIGLTGLSDVVDVTSNITDRIGIPLIVDADNGYGNALNVQRTVRLLERAGAAAIQFEDQSSPKRCGHLTDKSLISAAEMVGKIRAAADARVNDDTVIIARTDAISVEGFEPALERAERYLDAGCDVLFIEAPETNDQLRSVTDRFGKRVPLLANMVEGGRTPLKSASQLGEAGFSIVIFPGALARAFAFLGAEFFASLKATGTTASFQPRMLTFDELNKVIGTPQLLELGRKYE